MQVDLGAIAGNISATLIAAVFAFNRIKQVYFIIKSEGPLKKCFKKSEV
jgi:hypothetical protein